MYYPCSNINKIKPHDQCEHLMQFQWVDLANNKTHPKPKIQKIMVKTKRI